MSEFFIKKKVSLGFLGEEYQEAYIVVKVVPVTKYETIVKAAADGEKNNLEATKDALATLKTNFVEGKFPDVEGKLVDITAEDLDSFIDERTLTECYMVILGQNPDPKS